VVKTDSDGHSCSAAVPPVSWVSSPGNVDRAVYAKVRQSLEILVLTGSSFTKRSVQRLVLAVPGGPHRSIDSNGNVSISNVTTGKRYSDKEATESSSMPRMVVPILTVMPITLSSDLPSKCCKKPERTAICNVYAYSEEYAPKNNVPVVTACSA
jgi:hypothetical protein